MYVPPHLKKLQNMFNGGSAVPNRPPRMFNDSMNRPFNQGNNNHQGNNYQQGNNNQGNSNQGNNYQRRPRNQEESMPEKPIEDKRMTLKQFMEKKESSAIKVSLPIKTIGSSTISIKKDETKEEIVAEKAYYKPNDFWYDIYNTERFELFPEKDVSYDKLIWNNKISKQSMVKILQEQGTIKFNPIEYYKNTVQNQSKLEETIIDNIHSNIYKFILTFSKDKIIHNLTEEHFDKMISEISNRINSVKNCEESLKSSILDSYIKDVNELRDIIMNNLNTNRKSELAIKFGFKYHQQMDFINKFYTLFETTDSKDKTKENLVKQCSNDKVLTAMKDYIESGSKGDSKYPEIKFITNLDKFVKKECKSVNFLEDKYVNRYLEFQIMCSLLSKEIEKHKNNKKTERVAQQYQKRLDFYREEIVELKKLIRASVMPFQSIEMKSDVTEYQKDMDLYNFVNFKDKVICEKEKEVNERLSKLDEQLLKSINTYNYMKANVLDLSKMIHSTSLESNKVPFMIQLLKNFTNIVVKESPSEQVFLGYIETYLYIKQFIQNNEKLFEDVDEEEQEVYEKTIALINKYLKQKKRDVYEIQMRQLYEYLEPLSRFDENKPRLDNWQKDVFEMIDAKKNVIVIAPTSSGKTVLSTYCSIISEKLLFVVPSAELARQVCGMIRNLVLENKIKRNISLITEKDIYNDSNLSFDILVGTPGALESYFVEKNLQTDIFDYIVFDEVHQLNQDIVGAELERFVKWMTSDYTSEGKTKFLALSACVGNAEELHNWWKQFVKEIELVYCNRRFLQQQKFLWNNDNLNRINPLSVCNLEFLQSNGFIDGDFSSQLELREKSSMAFTPDDLYDLYSNMKSIEGFNADFHPEKFFKTTRISLENCKQWEWLLKLELQRLSREKPLEIQKLLQMYQKDLDKEIVEMPIDDLYKLLKQLQKKNMLPTILFRLDPSICQQKFTQLVYYLKERELKVYPTYYDDLKLRQDYYLEYLEKEKKVNESELPGAEQLENMNMTPQMYIEDKLKRLKEKELSNLIKKYTLLMDSHITYTKSKIQELLDSEKEFKNKMEHYRTEKQELLQEYDMDEVEERLRGKKKLLEEELKLIKDFKEIYNKQMYYYENEKEKIGNLQEISSVNIYKPHSEYTFLDEFITSEHIIEYRRQLMDYMKEEKKEQDKLEKQNKINREEYDEQKEKADFRKETYISYDHPFIMGIERGVVLYLNRLPTSFQRVAQSLIASTMRLAPVTFSDKSLAFGINYPIRSVILTGGYIDPIVAHQMIGRAGRRGVDPKGYTIYYDVDWKTIMKEKYLEVNGSDILDSSIWIMPYLWTNVQDKFDMVARYHLRDFTQHSIDLESSYETFMESIPQIYRLFNSDYNNELAPEGIIDKMKYDIYKNKHYGLQAVFMPHLLEELSRWKFNFNNTESIIKYDIIKLLTAFYNGDLENEIFSEHFRNKVKIWKDELDESYEQFIKTNNVLPKKFEEKVVECDIPYWIIMADLLASMYELSNDWRIKKLIVVIYSEIKGKIKKYTF